MQAALTEEKRVPGTTLKSDDDENYYSVIPVSGKQQNFRLKRHK